MNEFIKNFQNQFEETDPSAFSPDTKFRDLDEWCSLIAFAVLNMIELKYKIHIKAEDFLKINTIEQLYNYVQSKKN
jgi:acyl carrier protein